MPWARRRYRGNKAWVEVDDAGALVLDARGLARLRYKVDDDERTYSVRPAELDAVPDEDAVPAGPPADAGTPRPRKRKRRADAGDVVPADAAASAAPAAPAEGVTETDDPDLAALAGRELQVWTDGASSGNPGPAGAGAVLLFRERRKELSEYLGETTNNVAELTAVRSGLALVKKRSLPVRVMTDSTYVIGVLTGRMATKANVELVRAIRAELAAFDDLSFVKVAAHSGISWNERADALAREAIRTRRTSIRELGAST
jgi:ribonuclease HI